MLFGAKASIARRKPRVTSAAAAVLFLKELDQLGLRKHLVRVALFAELFECWHRCRVGSKQPFRIARHQSGNGRLARAAGRNQQLVTYSFHARLDDTQIDRFDLTCGHSLQIPAGQRA